MPFLSCRVARLYNTFDTVRFTLTYSQNFVATSSVPTPCTTPHQHLRVWQNQNMWGVPHLGLPLTHGDLVHATGPYRSPPPP